MARIRLTELISIPESRTPLETLDDALACLESAAARGATTAGRAVCAGLASDRVGYALLGGYDAALRRLLAPRELRRASFCASEAGGGAHPSAMETRIDERDGCAFITGEKSFATLATHADVFVVIGTVGEPHAGRKPLRAALVERGAAGLEIIQRPALPFIPEVPHAALRLADVCATELLPGDGYERYVKPFRTVEDTHVTLAVLGYALAEAHAQGWNTRELIACIDALAVIADESDPTLPETHLALDVELGRARAALDSLPWNAARSPIGERWLRDRPVLDVASRAREKRTERARERIAEK